MFRQEDAALELVNLEKIALAKEMKREMRAFEQQQRAAKEEKEEKRREEREEREAGKEEER